MNALDHHTFHALEIDALYDELDGPRAAEIHAHAASCASCASRFQRLRRARLSGLAALAEPVSNDFESRVMAAVDAALAKRAGGPVLVGAGAGAKVIPFFSRPSFAVAATLILVLGAAAILGQLSMAKSASPTAAAAPAEQAASSLTPVPTTEQPVAAAPAAAPVVIPPAIALSANEQSASDESDNPKDLTERSRSGAPAAPPKAVARRPAMVGANDPAPPPPPQSLATSKPIGGASGASDGSIGAAKALYNAGSYREALPRFEVLRASSPEADLYAARCVLRLSGCSAAIPRFDGVASRNAGSGIGNQARAESDSCNLLLQAAKNAAPNAAPAATATTGPGTPGGGGAAGRSSAPKAPAEQFDSK